MLGHELVELFPVLGVAQPIEEIPEFGLLPFEDFKVSTRFRRKRDRPLQFLCRRLLTGHRI